MTSTRALACSSMLSVPHWLSYSQKSQDQSQDAESGLSKTTVSPNRPKNSPLPFYFIISKIACVFYILVAKRGVTPQSHLTPCYLRYISVFRHQPSYIYRFTPYTVCFTTYTVCFTTKTSAGTAYLSRGSRDCKATLWLNQRTVPNFFINNKKPRHLLDVSAENLFKRLNMLYSNACSHYLTV